VNAPAKTATRAPNTDLQVLGTDVAEAAGLGS